MSSSAPEALAPRLERSLRARQAERLPSIAAAVVRDGETVWSGAVGLADLEAGSRPTPETQYRVGSITKTFTAVAVMQLRDAGKLDLDDRVEQHIPGIANGSPTLRRMLAHLSGLQREAGEMFVTGEAPAIDEILEAMADYELVLPAARAHHYSNLAYGLLGEVVARRSGRAVHRLRRRTDPGAARARAHELAGAGAARDRLPRRRVHGHRGTRAARRDGRRGGDGAALVDGGRSLPLGRVPRRRRAKACSLRTPSRRCGRRR